MTVARQQGLEASRYKSTWSSHLDRLGAPQQIISSLEKLNVACNLFPAQYGHAPFQDFSDLAKSIPIYVVSDMGILNSHAKPGP